MFKQPACPARSHRPAHVIPQPDPDRLQLERITLRLLGSGRKLHRCLLRHGGNHLRRLRLQRHIDRPRLQPVAAFQPVHILARRKQTVDRLEAVVYLVAQQITRRTASIDFPLGHGQKAVDLFKRPAEIIEHAVELNPHLIRQRPSGTVVRSNRRPTRKPEVVRIILRLKHVQQMRAEGLRRLEHNRTLRILLARYLKVRCRLQCRQTHPLQRVRKLHRRVEIRLIRRQNITARVPPFRLKQLRVILHRHHSALPPIPCHDAVLRHPLVQPFDVLRQDRPMVSAAPLDRVLAHPVNVVEQVVLMARSVIENRPVRRNRIFDRLPEVPLLLRCNRKRRRLVL